jgi:hypothetical protein
MTLSCQGIRSHPHLFLQHLHKQKLEEKVNEQFKKQKLLRLLSWRVLWKRLPLMLLRFFHLQEKSQEDKVRWRLPQRLITPNQAPAQDELLVANDEKKRNLKLK